MLLSETTLDTSRLETLIRQVHDLPALPQLALQVMRLADDPKASAADVACVLSADQAMTARLLKLANSAFYGAGREVSTVTEAIVMLGMRSVRNIAIALQCRDMLDAALPGYSLAAGDLWRHSFCCGCAAQLLAKKSGYRVTEEAFVGGLLHDIGKTLLNVYLQPEAARIARYAETDELAFMDAERAVLGFDHAEAGARILEKWKLPTSLVDCARYHHNPYALPEPSPLVGLVHVADVLCLMLGIGVGGDGLRYPLEDGILPMLRLTETDCQETMVSVCEAMTQLKLLL